LPVHLEDTDVAVLKSLMEDGHKSFRAISREIKVSTPTVKARYKRLVSMGLIKSIKLEIDLSKVNRMSKNELYPLKFLKEQKKAITSATLGSKCKIEMRVMLRAHT
jgi:DNA-binding Lrp family transcriptional regulator